MKVLYKYLLPLALVLSACASDTLEPESTDNSADESASESTSEIAVMAYAATLQGVATKADTPVQDAYRNGWYKMDYYPGTNLFLTTYHHDFLGYSQYYFQDIMMTPNKYDQSDTANPRYGDWRATGWYWPIQGEMEFVSYWSPKVYGRPTFREFDHADDSLSAWMMVNCRGAAASGSTPAYTGLDGKTDFLYIALRKIMCPQSKPIGLLYRHGLAWLTVSLEADVLDAQGNSDPVKTAEVIDKIKIQRIVIEDTSRKGIAYLVPGKGIAWEIDPEDVCDQVYTRPLGLDESLNPRGQYAYYDWKESADGKVSADNDDYITLSSTRQFLGLYDPIDEDHYTGNGLLLIPQHKTAITVYYKIVGGNADGSDLFTAEKYELRDNDDEWEPGVRYHYDIVFRSSVEELQKKNGVQLTETEYHILYSDDNGCFDPESFGQIVIEDSNGNRYKAPTFVLDPYHSWGSAFQDEMDYFDGGIVF